MPAQVPKVIDEVTCQPVYLVLPVISMTMLLLRGKMSLKQCFPDFFRRKATKQNSLTSIWTAAAQTVKNSPGKVVLHF